MELKAVDPEQVDQAHAVTGGDPAEGVSATHHVGLVGVARADLELLADADQARAAAHPVLPSQRADGHAVTSRNLREQLVLGVLRRRATLDAILAAHSTRKLPLIKPVTLECLRAGLFEMLYLDDMLNDCRSLAEFPREFARLVTLPNSAAISLLPTGYWSDEVFAFEVEREWRGMRL